MVFVSESALASFVFEVLFVSSVGVIIVGCRVCLVYISVSDETAKFCNLLSLSFAVNCMF